MGFKVSFGGGWAGRYTDWRTEVTKLTVVCFSLQKGPIKHILKVLGSEILGSNPTGGMDICLL